MTNRRDFINILKYNGASGIFIKETIFNSEYGEIDAKVKIDGLKGSFPRMLFVATANTKQKNNST